MELLEPSGHRFNDAHKRQLLDAASRGDLPVVQRYFELPDVRENVAVWNALHRAKRLEETPLPPPNEAPRPWYNPADDAKHLFETIIVGGAQVELFQWFFVREQLALFGETLRAITKDIIRSCLVAKDYTASREMVEIVVKSSLFEEIMEHDERLDVLGLMLNMAVSHGCHWWLDALLAYGADPNRVTNHQTPLPATRTRGNIETLDLLLSHAAWVEGQHVLSQRMDPESILTLGELLLNGPYARTATDGHTSLLHQASSDCSPYAVSILLDVGFADVDVRDARGCTPLMVVATYEDKGSTLKLQIIEQLLKRGASVHTVDAQGRGVAHHAVRSLNAELLRACLERGADPNLRDVDGQTPMATLLTENQQEVTEHKAQVLNVLLCAGADPVLLDSNGVNCTDILTTTGTGRAFVGQKKSFFLR